MKITTYRVAVPYSINGHKNVSGMAIADEINKRIGDLGISNERDLVEREMAGVDSDLYGLTIDASEEVYDE